MQATVFYLTSRNPGSLGKTVSEDRGEEEGLGGFSTSSVISLSELSFLLCRWSGGWESHLVIQQTLTC